MSRNKLKLVDQWEKSCASFLVGKTIKSVRYMTEKEVKNSMWYKAPLIIEFTDGSYIFSMADDEGNDGGAYYTSDKKLPTIPVIQY